MTHFSKALSFPAVFVLAAVSVISCITVDKSLGSGNIPDDQKLKMETASFNIPVDLKMADSLQGASTSYLMVGAINTAEMGLAQFSTAANIVPYYTGTRYGQDPVIISTYIVFVKSASVTMEDNQDGITQDIFVYRLKQPLDTINVYNNSINSSSYYPTPLNNKTITYYGGDTLKIYLNNSLGKELLTATDTELDSLNLFSKRFGGLYVKSSTPPAGIIRGRLNQFSFGDTYLYLKYNFQPTWKSGMARKDTTVVMSFGYKFCLNLSSYSTANKETTVAQTVLPVEGIGGIKPYIKMDALKDQIDAWIKAKGYDRTKILLSRATITFPFSAPENIDKLTHYPAYLFPCYRKKETDYNITYYYNCDDINSNGNAKGVLDRTFNYYSGDITSTIQKMITKERSELYNTYNFLLMPISSSTNSYGTTSYSINIFDYNGGQLNGPASSNPPTLQLFYTIMK